MQDRFILVDLNQKRPSMFIRKIDKRDSKSGKSYSAYYLVESTRTNRGPRQRVLLYMGANLPLPEEQHKILAQRIEEIVRGEHVLIKPAETIEQLANVYASQVIRQLSEITHEERGEALPPTKDLVTLDLNTLEKSEPRTVGSEHLLLTIAEKLQLSDKLKKLGFSDTELALALGTIISRAVFPQSEWATYDWLCNKSGLSELLDFDFKKVSHNRLYQISDRLLAHKKTLEAYLEETEKKVHGYTSTIALYDLTNVYMEGQAKANPKAAHGVSKEKRSDCPLITMGLIMNEHGFLHRTSILPGNASEPSTLKEMIENLSAEHSLMKPVIILDAGIATEGNLAWLREHNYLYIVSARQKPPTMDLEGDLVPVGDLKNQVTAALIKTGECEEKWLYCESKAKGATAASMKLSFKQRFEEDLQKLAMGLTKPKGRKKYTKILERLGRLKEKHKRIADCYTIQVKPSEDGQTAIALEWTLLEDKMQEKLSSHYLLRTNLTGMGPKELWGLYNTLRGVEDAFRFMKSSLGLRPVFHQKEHRVDGHLWITVLAYHLIQNCLYPLGNQGINSQWRTINNTMSSRVRVTSQAKTAEGKMLYHRSTTKAEQEQLAIYRALGISSQILKAKKTVV